MVPPLDHLCHHRLRPPPLVVLALPLHLWMAQVEINTLWVPIIVLVLQVALAQAPALDPVLAPVFPILDLALKLEAPQALEALVALLPLTRISFTNSEPRSWLIRCWPGDSLCQTTSRWLSRGKGPCLACSSSSPCPA